jgi:hypothetical protein
VSDVHGRVKSTVAVRVVDISEAGVQMELSAALRPGSTYELSVDLDGIALSGVVRITRCRAGGYVPDGKGGRLLLFRAGAEFIQLDGTGAKDFREWITRRTPESRPKGELVEPVQ